MASYGSLIPLNARSPGLIEPTVRIRPFDYLAVALVAALVLACGITIYRPGGGESTVLVEAPDGRQYYPLRKDAQIPVPGPLGTTVVEIQGGRVRIKESPCDNQICVAMGWIGAEGGWSACLPNRVFVRVKQGGDSGTVRTKSKAEEGGADARTW